MISLREYDQGFWGAMLGMIGGLMDILGKALPNAGILTGEDPVAYNVK